MNFRCLNMKPPMKLQSPHQDPDLTDCLLDGFISPACEERLLIKNKNCFIKFSNVKRERKSSRRAKLTAALDLT